MEVIESWMLTNRLNRKLQAVDMKYLRGVKGITRRDRITNDTIREKLGVKSILHRIESQ